MPNQSTRVLFYLFLIGICNYSCTNPDERTVIQKGDKLIISIKRNGVKVTDSIFDRNKRLREVDQYFADEGANNKSKIVYYGGNSSDSLVCEFFPNSVMKRKKRHFGNDMPIEEFLYLPCGKISSYLFYNLQENKAYRRNYSNDKVISETGVPFFNAYLMPAKEYFSEQDSIKALFIAPFPPNCETKLYTYQSGKSFNNIHQIDSTAMFHVQIYPLEKGNYVWDVFMELREKNTDKYFKSPFKIIEYSVK